jgi:ankyrin repeat protein
LVTGDTPLHIAVLNNNEYLVSLLLKFKCNTSIKNKSGFLPIDLCSNGFNINPKIKDLLNEEIKNIKRMPFKELDENAYIDIPITIDHEKLYKNENKVKDCVSNKYN